MVGCIEMDWKLAAENDCDDIIDVCTPTSHILLIQSERTARFCCACDASVFPFTIRVRRGLFHLPPWARFLEKHEERMAEEQKFLRETAEEKYRRTHDYNIIAGTYYDQNKEENFVESREKLGAMQGRAQQYRLPPSIRYGEGNDYNIISQQVCRRLDSSGLTKEVQTTASFTTHCLSSLVPPRLTFPVALLLTRDSCLPPLSQRYLMKS